MVLHDLCAKKPETNHHLDMLLKPKTLFLGLLLSVLSVTSLSAQAIVGAWYVGDTSTDGSDVIVFFGNGYYMHITDAASGGGLDGYERGTYTWSGVNGTSFTATGLVDQNGDNGLSHIDNGTTTFSITGDSLTITDADGASTGSDVLTRVTGANDIIGAWVEGNITVNDSVTVAVFMSNLTYFIASDLAVDGDGLAGIERGSYTWVSATGAFTSSADLNTDGGFGLSGSPPITSMTIASGVLTASDGSETATFNSVTAVPEPSTYAVIAGAFCLGIAMLRRRKQS